MSRRLVRSLALMFVALPAIAQASITFVGIGYDVPGADDGREWIAITNTGPQVDLSGWKLFEGGVNHKLVPGSSTLLPAGATAVIVQSPEGYLADHPGYAGLIFKASFSLSNTGEALALKNASSTVVASTTYTISPVAPAPSRSSDGKKVVVNEPRNLPPPSEVHTASATQVALVNDGTPLRAHVPFFLLGLIALICGGVVVAFMTRPTPTDVNEYRIEEDHS